MPTQNTHSTYGSVTKTFHWLTALLIVVAFPLGILAGDAPFATSDEIAQKAWLFSLHKTVGILAFFTAFGRILWAISQKKPALLNPDHRLEAFMAHLVHWLLYISMLMTPLSGWITHAASTGFAPVLLPFGDTLPFVPKSEALADLAAGAHYVFPKLLLITVVLHVAGALKHAFIDRDATLQRMLPFTPHISPLPAQTPHRAPMLVAIGIFAVATGFGAYLGQSKPPRTAPAQLTRVASDWRVTQGRLQISVRQFGNTVTGEFADWTARISFDQHAPAAKKGHVEVVISIGSLTLGAITDQALGFDYLAADDRPKATYAADIFAGENGGYVAKGTLTLKGVSQALAFPFELALMDSTAEMHGVFTLNRMDFGIGAIQPDDSSLGFNVAVEVELSAEK